MKNRTALLMFLILGFGLSVVSAQTPVKSISGGVLNGKATSLPMPVYPAAARAVNASGAVNVKVEINEQGNVISATAVSGHPLLRKAAEQVAVEAKFNPILLSGQPVSVSGVLIYNFVGSSNETGETPSVVQKWTLESAAKNVDDVQSYLLTNKSTVESVFLNRSGKSIKASFEVLSSENIRPRTIKLEFNGFWKGGGKPTNLQAEIAWGENERLTGRTDFSVKQCYREDKIECYEFLFTLPVAYETVENLLKSENVTMTFNDTALELTAQEINRLRDFVKSAEKR